jgi:hypothetical protein
VKLIGCSWVILSRRDLAVVRGVRSWWERRAAVSGRRLAFTGAETIGLLKMPRIDAARMTQLLAPGDATGASSVDKGRALETAIRYAFEQIPGLTCSMQDQRGAFETEEIDLLFANVAHEDGLARFETEILVEAKNWSKPVGAMEISWFATKMRRRNRHVGVLVATRGISGDPVRLTAARQQVMLALSEGQEVLVITRKELEAVSTGERLAQLIHKKRDHLVSRQDIYEAEPAELRVPSGQLRRGTGAFHAILRSERLRRIEEARGRLTELPDGETAPADALQTALATVEALATARRKDRELDPRWENVREALMSAAAICVAWLGGLGIKEANAIYSNVAMTGLDRLRPSIGSRLWGALSGYYVEELERESPELPRETLLFGLTGILIEEVWGIDEYWPEPDEY